MTIGVKPKRTATLYNYLRLISLLLLLSSCLEKNSIKVLSRSEILMNQRPDSALYLLESIEFPEDMSKENYAKYSQLIVLAHLNNKISIAEDSFVQNAVEYYQSDSTMRKDYIISLLLLGNVYEEQDSVAAALNCFHESYRQSEQLKDFNLSGLSAFELGGVYKYSGDYDKAIRWFETAENFYDKSDEKLMRLRSKRQKADCYVLAGDNDIALDIYNSILIQIPPKEWNLKADVYKNMSITYKNAKKYEESLYYIRKSIEVMRAETLLPLQYTVLASIYDDLDQKDSAFYYNRLAWRCAKEQDNLGMIYITKAAFFENTHPQRFNNFILSGTLSDSIYQKQKYTPVTYRKLYEVEKIKKKNKEITIEFQRYLFLSSLTILTLLFLYFYQKNKKRKIKRQYRIDLEEKNTTTNYIRDSLLKRLAFYQKLIRLSISPSKDKHKGFLKECNKLLFDIDDDFEIDWNILNELSNSLYNNYSLKIKVLDQEINEIEEKIIVLLKLGFNTTEISGILDKSIHTIYRYSSNLRKRFNIPENESISEFIENEIQANEQYSSDIES